MAYYALVRPVLEYASEIWDPYTKKYSKKLEKVQNQALRFIFKVKGRTSFTKLRKDTNIASLQDRRKAARIKLFLSCLENGLEPLYEYKRTGTIKTRQNADTAVPVTNTNIFYFSFWLRTARELRLGECTGI